MKCTETEKRIYLYRELTDYERQEIFLHVQTCDSCRHIMNMANAAEDFISILKKQTVVAHDSKRTDRIMSSISRRPASGSQVVDVFRQILSLQSLRYAMASLSLVLLAFLVGESIGTGKAQTFTKHARIPGYYSEVNVAAFHSAFFKARESAIADRPAISDCLSACLNASTAYCHTCKQKFSRHK